MSDKDQKEEEMKEFTILVENSNKTQKLVSEELEIINLGTKQETKELKMGTLITVEERDGLISLLHEYAYIFA